MKRNANTLRLLATMMLTTSASAIASPIHFQTNEPDGRMAMASHPPSASLAENESADDFILNTTTRISHAQFTGLLANSAMLGSVSQVVVEIYRVFPLDSIDPPSGGVPTRINSPSDNAFTFRDSAGEPAGLHYLMSVLNSGNPFTASNSVRDTLEPAARGDGQITGTEVSFDVVFDQPIVLPPGHYFFVPQVAVTTGDDFYWLSTARPITPPRHASHAGPAGMDAQCNPGA